jgi:hypothetical protein
MGSKILETRFPDLDLDLYLDLDLDLDSAVRTAPADYPTADDSRVSPNDNSSSEQDKRCKRKSSLAQGTCNRLFSLLAPISLSLSRCVYVIPESM